MLYVLSLVEKCMSNYFSNAFFNPHRNGSESFLGDVQYIEADPCVVPTKILKIRKGKRGGRGKRNSQVPFHLTWMNRIHHALKVLAGVKRTFTIVTDIKIVSGNTFKLKHLI
jgi:hypothetical protein